MKPKSNFDRVLDWVYGIIAVIFICAAIFLNEDKLYLTHEENINVKIVSADVTGVINPRYTVSVFYNGEVYDVFGKDFYVLYKNCIGQEISAVLVKHEILGLGYYSVELPKKDIIQE